MTSAINVVNMYIFPSFYFLFPLCLMSGMAAAFSTLNLI